MHRHYHARTLMFANAASVLIQAAMRFLRFGASLAASSFTGRGVMSQSPITGLGASTRSVCLSHSLEFRQQQSKNHRGPPSPQLHLSCVSRPCHRCKNLTGRSTWTPTAAMPSAFYWPLLVPCAPAGLRRQLTNSLGRVNAPRAPAKRATSSVATRSQACASWSAQGLVACLHSRFSTAINTQGFHAKSAVRHHLTVRCNASTTARFTPSGRP
jgi:hypothetical protein